MKAGMESIQVEFFIKEENGIECFYMKSLDTKWSSTRGSYIFSEVGESLLRSRYRSICFDLSNLTLISSSYLGGIMNLISLAKELKKSIKLRLNKVCMEPFEVASINKVIDIEVVA